MNVLIVEDEPLNAQHLQTLLQKVQSNVNVVAVYDTVASTVEAFRNGLEVDLIFLDIHLADGNSFDIFKQVQLSTPIIFTTAYNDYAIPAFKLNSIDYLLKPISQSDLSIALDKFNRQQIQTASKWIEQFLKNQQPISKPVKNRFMVKAGQHIDSISTEEVHHFQTQESITFLVDSKGKRYPIDYTLDEVEELIPSHLFFRINRKVILNIQSIITVNTYSNSRLQVIANHVEGDGSIVSRERVADFKAWLDT